MLALALTLFACNPDEPVEGTFIGNPSLTARVVDTPDQVATGGVLETEGLYIRGCDGADVQLDPSEFVFDGALSFDSQALPEGAYCGIFVPIGQLTLEFDDLGDSYAITGHDIDFELEGQIDASDESVHVIALGDEALLGELAALAEPGSTDANQQEPALRQAFIDGLERSSIEIGSSAP